MAADGLTSVPLATYESIGTWLSRQQQAAAPLPERVRTALLNLEYVIKAETLESLSEPEVGHQNWVGLLQEYRAARPFNGTREVAFTDSSIDPTGRGPLRWKCQVSIGEDQGAGFPRADVAQPTFGRKKDAKQYAAKCAVDWLREKGFMPQDGVKFPKTFMPMPMPIPQQQKQRQAPFQARPPGQPQSGQVPLLAGPGHSPSNPRPRQLPPATAAAVVAATNTLTSPFDDGQPSVRQQIAELSVALGLSPPAYKALAAGHGYYNAWADFGDFGPLLPFDAPGLSHVSDVLGEKAAKEMAAENLLPHLQAEQERRENTNQELIAQFSGVRQKA